MPGHPLLPKGFCSDPNTLSEAASFLFHSRRCLGYARCYELRMKRMTKSHEMNEIWIVVEEGEPEFELSKHPLTGRRILTLRGDQYAFDHIYSYRNYKEKTIRLKLTNAHKIKSKKK